MPLFHTYRNRLKRNIIAAKSLAWCFAAFTMVAASCQETTLVQPTLSTTSLASSPTATVTPISRPTPTGEIAFVSERRHPGDLDIWLMDIETDTLLSVTADDAHDTQPKWSPDGRYLAFRSQWPDRRSSIRVYETATGNLREIDPNDNPYDFDWLPNGQGFVYTNGEFDIKYLDLEGQPGDTVVQQGYSPRVSPDGKRIAFVRSNSSELGERLAVVSTETGAVDAVVDDPTHPDRGYVVAGYEWSFDSNRLFEARLGNRFSVPFLMVYGADLIPLAHLNIAPFIEPDQLGYGTNFCSPVWLPGSNEVSFVFQTESSTHFCTGRLYVSDDNLAMWRELVPGEDFAAPVPSSDGQLIVITRGHFRTFGEVVGSYHDRESSLWLINRDGNTLRLLTDGPGFDGEAAWRPSGLSD